VRDSSCDHCTRKCPCFVTRRSAGIPIDGDSKLDRGLGSLEVPTAILCEWNMHPFKTPRYLFYDLPDDVVPSVAGDQHHASSPDEWVRGPLFVSSLFSTPRDAAFCYNSSGFLAAPYAAKAAGYCGEPTVEAFLKRVGTEYPRARIKEGSHQLWLRDVLDRAIAPDTCRATSPRIFNTGTPAPTLRRGAQARRQLAPVLILEPMLPKINSPAADRFPMWPALPSSEYYQSV
jgi:hypothetical protein